MADCRLKQTFDLMEERKQQLEAIFDGAIALESAEQREIYLTRTCGQDLVLRREAEALIRAYEKAGNFLTHEAGETDQTSSKPASGGMAIAAAVEEPGTVIGRYKLREKIGEGGCGVVYVAEQEEPMRRRVALKVIKLGMDTRSVVARFEAERQALAMMDHPNIAKVFDAGATESGRPYFVMELVRGVRITDYCDQHQFTTQQRLDLFVQVCQAVQHAHQKGIIHRDLKPSNILVTLHDGVPVPKVIDFGIAKATEGRLTDKTIYTELHQFIGTPAYMSPEQAQMNSQDIDTRSDIYSLGVLLYELLTGQTPFDAKELLKAGLDEMRRTIREKEPERPSTRLRQTSLTTSGSELITRHSSLATDLDWIVMKCLEKDRNRRYETANGLAADIHRHLDNETVWARPPSVAYRFQKAFRRNKAGFAAGAVIGVVLLLGIVLTSWQATRANRERAVAERRLKASLKFASEIFDDLGPKLRETIGTADADHILTGKGLQLMEALRQDADTDTEFRFTLGRLHLQFAFSQGWWAGNSAANFEASLNSAAEAVHLLLDRSSDPEAQVDLSRAEMVAGYAALGLLRYDQAIAHFRQMDRWAAAAAAQQTNSAMAAEGRTFKRWAFGSIGEALLRKGDFEQALTNYFLPFHRDVLARNISDRSTNRIDLHDLQCSHANLGVALKRLSRPNEALPHLRESLKASELIAGASPNRGDQATFLIEARSELGELLLAVDQSNEGRALLTNALQLAESLVERDSANTGFALSRISVLRLTASGLASASLGASGTLGERRARLDEAQLFLDRAEQLIGQLPNVSARNWIAPDMKATRDRVTAARASFADHPPPFDSAKSR
jgi:tetratricopeptide (TPR) repeat protein